MNKKLNNTKFARVLRRLFGEETGATMMEYVILAVMIAAAVTAAAIYFGNSAKNQMDVAGAAMVGKPVEAGSKAQASMETQSTEAGKAHEMAQKFSKGTELQPNAGSTGGGTSSGR